MCGHTLNVIRWRGETLEVLPEFRAVLATRAGRDWSRGRILAWLEQRARKSNQAELGRLAQQLRGVGAVAELLLDADDDPAGLGLEVRHFGSRREVLDGDPAFGERLLAYYVLHKSAAGAPSARSARGRCWRPRT